MVHLLANCVFLQGKQDQTRQLYRLTLSFHEGGLRRGCSEILVNRHDLAVQLEMIGNYEEAAQHWRIVLASSANCKISSHPGLDKLMDQKEGW